MTIKFSVAAEDGSARTGTLETPHGPVATPAFMPVGTRGAVKAIDSGDLREVGAQMVLANTYHLMLRPGAERVANLGGLHEFMAWEGPILTDSGGFQVFSLDPDITEQGARFRSVYDGSEAQLTPEDAARYQELFGSDIAMVLDVCVGLPAPQSVVSEEMGRTLRWTERFLEVHERGDQAVFGIVQGGVDSDLRADSARRTALLPVDGFGIGGLSVGESDSDRRVAMSAAIAELPSDRTRYVMGVGDPAGVLDAVGLGADLFDCVWPTRLARHGKVLTRNGDYSIKGADNADSREPLEEGCPCAVCDSYSRGYLRHLVTTKEPTYLRLLTIHNLTYTFDLMSDARQAISDGRFEEHRAGVLKARTSRKSR